MASYYYKPSVMIAAAIICMVKGISWQESNDAFWARGCDFVNDDIANVRVPGEECSAACGATTSCTHFAWSQRQGGTCWLKSRAGGINTDSAIASTQPGILCGVMKTNSALLSLGGSAVDVAETFVDATKQVSTLQNLANFIVSVVLQDTADTSDLDKLVQVLNIIAKQSCEVIFVIFREIEVLIVDDIILEKLLETVSASEDSLFCVLSQEAQNSQMLNPSFTQVKLEPSYFPTATASTTAQSVSPQTSCRKGTTRCEWWEKQQRNLLNGSSQCETQYTCKFYGFNSKPECERQCP